jgi:hypothetical protein
VAEVVPGAPMTNGTARAGRGRGAGARAGSRGPAGTGVRPEASG